MQPVISVIICTHNPRRIYLERVLAALKSQTLPLEHWELVLLDNASEQLLSTNTDLSWHPKSRHVREEELGLTAARLRGISESTSEIIIFVDDDNALDEDYLEVALRISKDFPFLGAWGGQILPEFEVPPPEWTKPFWGYLAIRELDRDKWSNLLYQFETTPHGAGICIRREVAEKYAELVLNDPKRARLDRKGKQLMSCGDTDMAFTACDMGFGIGLFTSLKLAHLIPANRLTQEYFFKLVTGTTYSLTILDSFRGKFPTPPNTSLKAKVSELYRLWTMQPEQRQMYIATKKATALATQEISASM